MTESPHPNPPHKGEGEARARRAGIRGAAHARGVIALLLGLATTVPAAAQEGTPTPQAAGVLRDYAVRALDDFIRPAIAGVAEAAATLDETLAAFCAAPAPDLRPAADEAFAAVVTAWAAVIALQIEPLAVDSRRERFFFWPDPRGITLRQVQAIVAARDPTAADPVSLAGKSAAIQGLGALEYLLFGSGSEALLASGEESRFRCAYAVAIGGNLVAIADALATDVAPGSPFATAMASPGPANALFPAEADAAADLALSIVTAVELVEDRILVAALGTADDIGQPRAAPLWRSGLTLDFAAGLLGSAARLVDAAGTAAAIPANQAWLPDQIRSETERAIAALPAAGIGAAVADPDLRRQTTLARVIVDNLRTLLAVSLPAALGVALGFNALDGDG